MVVGGFYKVYGVIVTDDERKKLMELGWADEDPDLFPGKKFCRGKKEKRCELVNVPHGFEDMEEYEDKWFFGVGVHISFGPSVDDESDEDDGFINDYAHLSSEDLFDIISKEINFTGEAAWWNIPDDCPCCS